MAEDDTKKKFSMKAALTTAAAVVGFVATVLSLWFSIDGRIKDTVTESTLQITQAIKQSTYEVVELHKDDLSLRIRILDREIQAAQAAGQPVPERKLIQLDTLEDQLEDIKDRWRVD